MSKQNLEDLLLYADFADKNTNGVFGISSKWLREIVEEIRGLRKESELDYSDMRSFQAKYIESDQQKRSLESALTKIAFLKNEWDDPIDFINDLQNIAKESLIK